jgi:hypothetical protein
VAIKQEKCFRQVLSYFIFEVKIRKTQRCLQMLSELHRLGYQQQRRMPYLNTLGLRLAIAKFNKRKY